MSQKRALFLCPVFCLLALPVLPQDPSAGLDRSQQLAMIERGGAARDAVFAAARAAPARNLGDWQDPHYRNFNVSAFDRWFLKASFDENNVPQYGFFIPEDMEDGREWEYWDTMTQAYVFDGTKDKNQAATGLALPKFVNFKKMKVYSYRGHNPLMSLSQENSFYEPGMIDRFRFYRFTGDAKVIGIGVSVDQYIMAVDTYSKFVFAYGEISEVEKKFGQLVPVEYRPVEFPKNHQGGRPFYEYDPIGFVNPDGTVILYDEYRREMAEKGAVNYFPSIHDPGRDVAYQSSQMPGCSPYYLYKQAD